MDFKLFKARLISFGYSVATLIVVTILGVLTSQDFAAIVHQHFGDGATATLILLLVTEGVKHARNISVLNKAAVGGQGGDDVVLI